MADPFALMTRALDRGGYGGRGQGRGGGYGGGYGVAGRKKRLDPTDPKDMEYLRRMNPDFDEVMGGGAMDYKAKSAADPNFATKFGIPPAIDATRTFKEHLNSVDAVCWGPEPGQFVSASHDKTIKVWDAQKGKSLETLEGHVAGIYHCAVASSRKLLVSCGSGTESNLLLWQWAHKKSKMELKGHRRSVIHATFSPDSQSTSSVDQEGSIFIHDLATGKISFERNIHYGSVLASSYCRENGQILCTAGYDGFVRVLDLREQAAMPVWRQPSTVYNCSTPGGTGLVLPFAHDSNPVYATEFTASHTIYSAGGDNKMKRWDLRNLEQGPATQYLGHTSAVRSLCVSPDERFLVSGCDDGSCRVWHRDPIEEVRKTLTELRDELQQLKAQLNETLGDSQKQRLEGQATALRKKIAGQRETQSDFERKGGCTAVKTLAGHLSQVSGISWQEDGKGSVGILSSSWDQSCQLTEVSLNEFA